MLKDRNRQREAHQGLTNSLPEDLVQSWEGICLAWENAPYPKDRNADGSKLVNPFSIRRECEYIALSQFITKLSMPVLTQAEVETELALEDELMERKGIPLRHRTRPAKFILMGLDLEESQCVLNLFQSKISLVTGIDTSCGRR